MKFILPAFSLLFLSIAASAQDNSSIIRYIPTDTIVHTSIEALLRQKNAVHKVEYIDGASVGGIYYSVITVHNTASGVFETGVYVGSNSWPNTTSFNSQTTPHAYIDNEELPDLIKFFENCDSVWKKTPANNRTSYEYETTDGFRVSFGAGAMSAAWRFAFQFRSYTMYYTETTGKGKTTDLLYTFKLLKNAIDKIKSPEKEK
jgi:hypothetical protein